MPRPIHGCRIPWNELRTHPGLIYTSRFFSSLLSRCWPVRLGLAWKTWGSRYPQGPGKASHTICLCGRGKVHHWALSSTQRGFLMPGESRKLSSQDLPKIQSRVWSSQWGGTGALRKSNTDPGLRVCLWLKISQKKRYRTFSSSPPDSQTPVTRTSCLEIPGSGTLKETPCRHRWGRQEEWDSTHLQRKEKKTQESGEKSTWFLF